ncbi:MAG: hypothetical protein RLO81_05215 [Fulvivirga sp.]|uniref:hypothetical protein n=1 Tax=Fulvivirga sp. TaxID=1931237 RepID=UPI0032F0420B
MEKKLLLFVLILLATNSWGQINKYFEKKEASSLITLPEFTFPDFSQSYTLEFSSLQFEESGNIWDVQAPFVPVNQAWIGTTQESNFMWNNRPVKTTYQFDVNGRLRSSSMSFKLNK